LSGIAELLIDDYLDVLPEERLDVDEGDLFPWTEGDDL